MCIPILQGMKKQKLPRIPCTSLDGDLGPANEKHFVNLEFVILVLYPKLYLNLLIPSSQLKGTFLNSTVVAMTSKLLSFLTVLEVASLLEGQWWHALDSFLESQIRVWPSSPSNDFISTQFILLNLFLLQIAIMDLVSCSWTLADILPLFWYAPLPVFLPLINFYLYYLTTSHLIPQRWSTFYISGEKNIDNIIEEFLYFLPNHLRFLDPLPPPPRYLFYRDNPFTFALDPIFFIYKNLFPYCIFDFSLLLLCAPLAKVSFPSLPSFLRESSTLFIPTLSPFVHSSVQAT